MHDPGSAAPHHRPGSWLTVLGWAAYLACSWTWCIGMFLPVLLIRDFGIWGYIVFAVPNVVGAGAVGWIVNSPSLSASITQTHRVACRWFSVVTILFQLFFCWWLVLMSPRDTGGTFASRSAVVALILAGCVLAVAAVDPDGSIARRFADATGRAANGRRRMLAPLLLWLVSMGFASVIWSHGQLRLPAGADSLSRVAPGVLPLAPVCAFGFLLCPHLDLTLHHARQRAGSGGQTAFTVGFGVFFLALILFTLGYAHLFLDRASFSASLALAPLTAFVVFGHIVVQAFYTALVHLFEIMPRPTQGRRFAWPSFARVLTIGLSIVAVMLAPALLRMRGVGYAGLDPFEITYRLFMSFYGLVFPAYVWLCMIPTRDGHSGPSRAKIRIWLFSVGVAAPMFWMGFVERHTWWLAPGLGIVLLARLFLPRQRTPAPTIAHAR